MKTIIFFISLLTIFSTELTNSGIPYSIEKSGNALLPVRGIILQSNNIHTVIRTDGILNFDNITLPQGTGGFIWPASSSNKLLFTSGIWIGAKVILPGNQKEIRLAASMYATHYSQGNIPVIGSVPPVSVCNDSAYNGYLVSTTDQSLVNGGVRTKVAGGRNYTLVYSSWSAWPVNLGAPYIEVNGIPGYQPGWNADRPGNGVNNSSPDDLIFTVFMDYTNCTNNIHDAELSLPGGSLPLGVEIHQVAFAYLLPGLMNSYFVTYKIINKSGKNWDSTYFSLVNDGDIGDANDDAVGCDSSKNLAYTYNFNNSDPEYGTAPPAVGYKIIQGPAIYTGLNSDTAKFPCYKKIGYKMIYMSGHNRFLNGSYPCTADPNDYYKAYNYMKGKDGCGADIYNPVTGKLTQYVYNNSSWNDADPADKRNLINSGPFSMASGDTQVVTYLYSAERGSSNIQSIYLLIDNLERVNNYYYDCSGINGIEPINNSVPEKFALMQNYPNPFNPETRISFSIPRKSFVEIKVFDALGREAALLLNEDVNAGNYDINFNASSYSSGVYFYRIVAGDFNESKKMILVK